MTTLLCISSQDGKVSVMQDSVTTPQWEEENSQDFIDHGKYFVPDREVQIARIFNLQNDLIMVYYPSGKGLMRGMCQKEVNWSGT